MSTPQLVAVVPSEDFLQSLSMVDRRITIHRVFYDLFAASFPAYARRIPVTLIFCGGAGDYSGRVHLTDPAEYLAAQAEFSFKAVYGRLNCDRGEKSSFSTQSNVTGPSPGMSLPPTLDQAGWEIPASSAARLVGVAGPRMKLARFHARAISCAFAVERNPRVPCSLARTERLRS